jgi:hypothetical protein
MARSFFTPIMVLFTIAFTAVVCMDRLCHMHAEYMKQVSKLEQDLKMLVICRNETHKSVLSTYTPVCLELESNARIGAFMLALNTVTGGDHFKGAATELMHSLRALSWPLLLITGVAFCVCPSLIISGMRSRAVLPPQWKGQRAIHLHDA